ncbi:MAG: hypothetical protein IJ735_08015 [Clostridia bacterium]|nr:hypothetical protein [Clostridia bacterium]
MLSGTQWSRNIPEILPLATLGQDDEEGYARSGGRGTVGMTAYAESVE